ncbi:MAG TPA: hypothetical protein VFQ32_09415 [Ktedonobacterales bacterium]|nr:hypothetical protein [Ktedonobacterales bacterium]
MRVDGDEPRSKAEIDALTAAFFQVVSFDEGERPAYSRLYDLFIESGQIIKNSGPSPEISTVQRFIEPRQRTVDAGDLTQFRESETAEITAIFGNVAHRLSIYEKHGVSAGTAIDGRGVISIQFIATDSGWKISSMVWDDERPGLTLPERYQRLPMTANDTL